MNNRSYIKYLLILIVVVFASCNKFLDIKPSSSQVIPQSLDDLQQLLDNGSVLFNVAELLELQADDYYLESDFIINYPIDIYRNRYVWADDVYGVSETEQAWNENYSKVFYANAVLDELNKMAVTDRNRSEHERLKGSAYFLRAYGFYLLCQVFAPAYDGASSNDDLGIPILLSSDVKQAVKRCSVQESYNQIISDLKEAEKLLQNGADFSRPSKPANYALLARVYLSMRKYAEARIAADSSLKFHNKLLDYNQPLPHNIKDLLFYGSITPGTIIKNARFANPTTLVDTNLLALYEMNDLRPEVLFVPRDGDNKMVFRDRYSETSACIAPIDADEQYLIRAECAAIAGDIVAAMKDVNHLLKHRYKKDVYVDKTATSSEEAREIVLEERRKELVMRGLRWSDLRRLNKEGREISLYRKVNEEVYTLKPNHAKWVFPIPPNEIKTSRISQNVR